ncbi:putative iron-sulfur protein [Sphingobium sp. SYK-6]|uniref:aromatic ring-hydroxylating dioxygenase subunit alpha n=1 Tax=Sphingobium sp. (strain NBRC 103272 / SYK-6) TaxID=627192 RepID=UPI0002277341|nr:aromatic ring-hydroxylating dioxygenase subunit alpha [Sphingobium sp. SYK-6]BAK66512.1 putative iron-sulfur protein [Sphingobium sp. SYK-6]
MSIYLENVWYAAAFSDEVGEKPLARKLLDQDLMIYRDSAGRPILLQDRCPHRFAPLSLGKTVGDEIECPYHGLRFDRTGACSHNPHMKGGGPLRAAAVRAYPVMEKYGILWFWPGDPGFADEAILPKVKFLEETDRYRLVKGLLHVEGNYQLVIDNLLDLSHAQFIHPGFAIKGVDAEQALAATTTRLERQERSILNYRLRTGLPAPAAARRLFGVGEDVLVNAKTHMTWYPPAMIDFDAGTWEMDTPEEEGALIPQLHFITPETELSCHYFFVNGRNQRTEDKDVDDALLEMFDQAFRREDEPIIEAVQRRMGPVTDIHHLNPVLLQTDAAPISARRLLAKLIEQEKQPARSKPSPEESTTHFSSAAVPADG